MLRFDSSCLVARCFAFSGPMIGLDSNEQLLAKKKKKCKRLTASSRKEELHFHWLRYK